MDVEPQLSSLITITAEDRQMARVPRIISLPAYRIFVANGILPGLLIACDRPCFIVQGYR